MNRRAAGQRCECVLRAGANCQITNSSRLNERQGRNEIRSGDYVADFPRWYLSLSRHTSAFPKSGKIEGKYRVAQFSQPLCVQRRHLFFDGQPRARHDNGRLSGEEALCISIKTPDQRYAITKEDDLITVDHL